MNRKTSCKAGRYKQLIQDAVRDASSSTAAVHTKIVVLRANSGKGVGLNSQLWSACIHRTGPKDSRSTSSAHITCGVAYIIIITIKMLTIYRWLTWRRCSSLSRCWRRHSSSAARRAFCCSWALCSRVFSFASALSCTPHTAHSVCHKSNVRHLHVNPQVNHLQFACQSSQNCISDTLNFAPAVALPLLKCMQNRCLQLASYQSYGCEHHNSLTLT